MHLPISISSNLFGISFEVPNFCFIFASLNGTKFIQIMTRTSYDALSKNVSAARVHLVRFIFGSEVHFGHIVCNSVYPGHFCVLDDVTNVGYDVAFPDITFMLPCERSEQD